MADVLSPLVRAVMADWHAERRAGSEGMSDGIRGGTCGCLTGKGFQFAGDGDGVGGGRRANTNRG